MWKFESKADGQLDPNKQSWHFNANTDKQAKPVERFKSNPVNNRSQSSNNGP